MSTLWRSYILAGLLARDHGSVTVYLRRYLKISLRACTLCVDANETMKKGCSSYVRCCVQGVGPSIVTDICQGAGLDADLPVAQLQQEDWSSLYEQWREWVLTISSGAFVPRLDARSGSLSVLGSQRAERPPVDLEDVQESSTPTTSVHQLLDRALRSTEVHCFLC